MAKDDPYDLDFFQTVTDCHFGSNWLFVNMSVATPSFIPPWQMRVDFIGEAGGTPGFLDNDGELVPAATYTITGGSSNYRIKPNDLGRDIRTAAGHKLKGFSVNFHSPGINNPTSAYFLIQLIGFNSPLRVRASRVVDPTYYSNVAVAIGTVSQKTIKPGLLIPQDLTFVAQANMLLAPASTDFLIDLNTLAIRTL